MVIDGNRILVASAFSAACKREGLPSEMGIWSMLCHWGCHRDDWYADEPVQPAADWPENDARRRVVEETRETARAAGEKLPDDITIRMLAWTHDVRGWNA